jgi:hypothetical protein
LLLPTTTVPKSKLEFANQTAPFCWLLGPPPETAPQPAITVMKTSRKSTITGRAKGDRGAIQTSKPSQRANGWDFALVHQHKQPSGPKSNDAYTAQLKNYPARTKN